MENETNEPVHPEVTAWLKKRNSKGGKARMSSMSPEEKANYIKMITEKSVAARKAKKEAKANADNQ